MRRNQQSHDNICIRLRLYFV